VTVRASDPDGAATAMALVCKPRVRQLLLAQLEQADSQQQGPERASLAFTAVAFLMWGSARQQDEHTVLSGQQRVSCS
jgi:hypothetical protein